jgi:hypothetical protein
MCFMLIINNYTYYFFNNLRMLYPKTCKPHAIHKSWRDVIEKF